MLLVWITKAGSTMAFFLDVFSFVINTHTYLFAEQCPIHERRKTKAARSKSPTKWSHANTPSISTNDCTECQSSPPSSSGWQCDVNFCLSRSFKKRAPRAVKELKKFAEKMMKTPDVRIDSKLNKEIWSQGIKSVLHFTLLLLLLLCSSRLFVLVMFLTVFECDLLVNETKMKIPFTNSTHWSPSFEFLHSKVDQSLILSLSRLSSRFTHRQCGQWIDWSTDISTEDLSRLYYFVDRK